jgi:hypothetical protein
MNWLTELKAKAKEHTLSLVISLTVLLVGVIWAAIPSELWSKVSAAIPKRVLWSVIGLLVLGLIFESAYVANLRSKFKLKWQFGIRWSKSLEPFCPVCPTPLSSYGQHAIFSSSSLTWGFICPQCKDIFPMTDNDGNTLELKQAKQLLVSKPGKSHESEDNGVDEIEERILLQMARKRDGLTEDDFAGLLKMHPDHLTLILGQMDKKGYVYGINTMLGYGDPTTYHLSDKGRAFLVKKNLI